MTSLLRICLAIAALLFAAHLQAQYAPNIQDNINLVPKYGNLPKTERQKQADKQFLADRDKEYQGDRRKASRHFSHLGWQYYRFGDVDAAMRRFNQAWLLDRTNGDALWGMAAIVSNREQHREALELFSEANESLPDNLRFQVDFARALAKSGVGLGDRELVDQALTRFEAIYRNHPNDTLNLVYWAQTLHVVRRPKDAWEKIQLARQTPNAKLVSSELVEAIRRSLAASSIPPGEWRSRDGRVLPESPARRFVDGLGVWLRVTADPDWEAKFNNAKRVLPELNEADQVRRGGKLTILILIAGAKPDAQNNFRVSCDLRVVRPDGLPSVDAPGEDCLSGPVKNAERSVRLAEPTIAYSSGPGDLAGVWTVQVTVRDAVRGVEVPVKAQFTLLE